MTNLRFSRIAKFYLAALLAALLAASPAAYGQLYKWVDADGKVHYGDSPPENAQLKEITGNVSSFESVSVEPFVFDPNMITQRKTSKQVVMYSAEWCGVCKKAARYFRQKGIGFTELDIEKSDKAAREFKRLGGRGVPVILVGDQRMNGFSASAFDRMYNGNS